MQCLGEKSLKVPGSVETVNSNPILIQYRDHRAKRYQSLFRSLLLASRCTRETNFETNFCIKTFFVVEAGEEEGGRGGGRGLLAFAFVRYLFYLFFRVEQKERKKEEIMMGAQKYLPDDLDVKEQKDAHIGSDTRCDKKLTFLFNL